MKISLKAKKLIALIAATTMLVAGGFQTFAQTSSSDTTAEKAQLQQQLDALNAQIAQYQQQLTQIQGQKNTLQNKINALKKQQATITLQIKATNLQISSINSQLSATQAEIASNTAKQQDLKKQVGTLMTAAYQNDDYSLLYLLISQDNLSDVLDQLESYSQVSDQLRTLLDETKATNDQLSSEEQVYLQQQDDANNLLAIQSLQQSQLTSSVSQQNQILTETKGKESNYQSLVSNTTAQANAIRNQLYQLTGTVGNQQIDFGQAVTIAEQVQNETGVRAAFLLAILTQESNLGKNVGTCNRPGDPPSKSYTVVMKPDRDIQPFLQITSDLGLDPDITPVSCPEHNPDGSQLGWGGAMGPAQFIPSTWMGYKDQVAAITGQTANPWDINDAFLAAAIKLKAGGAGTQAGEWAAAMRYFSGGTNPKYSFYGDSVVAKAAEYQTDINNLNQ